MARISIEEKMRPIIADLIAKKGTPGEIGLRHEMSFVTIRKNLKTLGLDHLLTNKKPKAVLPPANPAEEARTAMMVRDRYFTGTSITLLAKESGEHESRVRERIANALPEEWHGV